MLRSPSLPLHDYDDLSSPDPLATSLNDENAIRSSPMKPISRSPSKSIQKSPRRRSAQTSLIPTQSPSKTVSEQILSPWKIRVTVEAEPEDGDNDTRATVRTMKIPLRRDSSPLAMTSIEKRGRKTQGTTQKSRRSATPIRGRSGSRRRKSVTDLDLTVLGDEDESDDWTKSKATKKTSRSRSRKNSNATGKKSSTAENSSKLSSKKDKQPQISDFEIREDSDLETPIDTERGPESQSPELRSIDLNRVSVRPRAYSIKQKDEQNNQGDRPLETRKPMGVPEIATRKVSNISTQSYPTPSPTTSNRSDSEDNEKPTDPTDVHEGFDTILESEGFTMIDLDSIPSARNFLSSPVEAHSNEKEADEHATKDQPLETSTSAQHQDRKPTAIPSYLSLAEGESDLSSNVPSSPPVVQESFFKVPRSDKMRKVTPQPYSSPKLPSPPKATTQNSRHQRHQTLTSEVLEAGVALQGALSPQPQSHSKVQKLGNTPVDKPNDIFDGFDSGTKRELRAGLRFGEELAKREVPSSSSENKSNMLSSNKIVPQAVQHKSRQSVSIWRGEAVVQHSPVGLQDLQKTRNAPSIQPSEHTKPMHTPERTSVESPSRAILDTMAKREREWSLERQAISKQIQNANDTQVIVIDSDSDIEDDETQTNGRSSTNFQSRESPAMDTNESVARPPTVSIDVKDQAISPEYEMEDAELEDEDEDADVWLEEARNTSIPEQPSNASELFTHSEQRRQRERASEIVNKPRRSLIPSPWKRGEDVAEASTFLTIGEESGMFWRDPVGKARFGAGEIARQKRELSGSFDVDRMAGAPRKVGSSPSLDHSQSEIEMSQIQDCSIKKMEDDLDEDIAEIDSPAEESDVEDSSLDPEENNLSESNSSKSNLSDSKLSNRPVKIPVKFNDSTLSIVPSPTTEPSAMEDPEPSQPSTPRSAMKGSRQSLGLEQSETPGSERRVVFSERSRCQYLDGEESTISAKFSSPPPDPALAQPEEKISLVEESSSEDNEHSQVPETKASGWLGWVWRGKTAETETTMVPVTSPNASTSMLSIDGTEDANETHQWQPAGGSLPSRTKERQSQGTTKLPSYLLPPSYPSDPKRDPNKPLATSGEFENVHFRTLHIIYRKSQRPRFHAPKHIRPDLKKLLGLSIEVDESRAGMGLFEWKCGHTEVEVLERFMQEVEYGWHVADRECRWSWTVDELAHRLCRVVVGEVVREEERQTVRVKAK